MELLPIFRRLYKKSAVSHNRSKRANSRRFLMACKPRSTHSITDSAALDKSQDRGLTAQDVQAAALSHLTQGVDLARPDDARYSAGDLFAVLLYAAAHRTTIEQAGKALADAPHANTVRGALAPLDVERLELELHQTLLGTWPDNLLSSPLEVAIDLTLLPYYGEAQPGEEDFLVTGPAKQGTTTFFAYASSYVIKKNKRVTLALTVVRQSESLLEVLQRLLERFFQLGGQLRCLYLDRQFYSVQVLQFLIEQQDLPVVVAAQKRGTTGGINGLIAREGTGLHAYTVSSTRKGKVDVQVAIVGKYLNGRWGKHGHEFYAYVVHRYPFALSSLYDKYRRRFGIESSYRVWNQGRAGTATRRVSLRLLLVGIAVLLYNLWIWLKWTIVSRPRRGGRLVFHHKFPFRRMLLFLAGAIEDRYGAVNQVIIPTHS
jgi:putative transposase